MTATAKTETGTGAQPRSWPALRAYSYWALQYRRVWRGTIATTLVTPALFLAALGYGLGGLIEGGGNSAGLDGVTYLQFLAPGLLAATAMQVGSDESMWPVMGAVKWMRTYHAMLATPLSVTDVFVGHLLWIGTRVLIACAAYLGVMTVLGATVSAWALLAVPAGVLVGMAFVAPIMAFAARTDNDERISLLYRFGIVPLFLFSGTFFPISQLPGVLQPVAWATPLWHGVDLCRSLALGTGDLGPAALHVGYLCLWVAAGCLLAQRAFRSRLVT